MMNSHRKKRLKYTSTPTVSISLDHRQDIPATETQRPNGPFLHGENKLNKSKESSVITIPPPSPELKWDLNLLSILSHNSSIHFPSFPFHFHPILYYNAAQDLGPLLERIEHESSSVHKIKNNILNTDLKKNNRSENLGVIIQNEKNQERDISKLPPHHQKCKSILSNIINLRNCCIISSKELSDMHLICILAPLMCLVHQLSSFAHKSFQSTTLFKTFSATIDNQKNTNNRIPNSIASPFIILFTPSSEICRLIEAKIQSLCQGLQNMRTCRLSPDTPLPHQFHRLKQDVQILVVTPDRFLDILKHTGSHFWAVKQCSMILFYQLDLLLQNHYKKVYKSVQFLLDDISDYDLLSSRSPTNRKMNDFFKKVSRKLEKSFKAFEITSWKTRSFQHQKLWTVFAGNKTKLVRRFCKKFMSSVKLSSANKNEDVEEFHEFIHLD